MKCKKLQIIDEGLGVIHSIEIEAESSVGLSVEDVVAFLAQFIQEPYKMMVYHEA